MKRSLHSGSFVAAARANEAFDLFSKAETLPDILGHYQNICDQLRMKPDVFTLFYPKLKANLKNWKSKEIFDKFDSRAKNECYANGLACHNTKVLVIGAGPCGLRTAIEAQLLGAKVVLIEKRNYICRNNVLRLWPFVIEDLRNLGATRFARQFCISSIDHVSIKKLQCMLLKVALLLGVEIHTGVSFEQLIEPNAREETGWRAQLDPIDHPVSKYDFDVIVGADGGRSSFSKDFKQKELRSKRAIAITVNFVNNRTEAETKVPEISGVSYIYNQEFFKKLDTQMGIDLENIIYYRDDTHYFVMTPKKSSLIAKGVIKEDLVGAALLHPDNVNKEALMRYAKEAAEFSTKYQLPNLEFAANHYGRPDICIFDFSTMYATESSSKVVVRSNYKLLKLLVGDGLLQPFWPTGSGCARGFLSSFDAAWAMKAWSSGVQPLEVLAERESIFKLLAQTTSENLNKNFKAFTLDPCTRYRNLNRAVVSTQQVLCLYDTDDSQATNLPINKLNSEQSVEVRRLSSDKPELNAWNRCQSIAHIAPHDDDIAQDLPKTKKFSNLVSKFETFSSGSLQKNINVFGPSARRGISTVQSAKTLKNQASPKRQEEKINRSKPTVAAKRPSYIESAKIALKKFRRSNAKDLDKTQTHKDVSLNEKELQSTPIRGLKRSNDQYHTDDGQATNLSEQSVEVYRNEITEIRPNKCKSVDASLGLSSDKLALKRNKNLAIAHISCHNDDNAKDFPKTDIFSNLVFKFDTSSSDSLQPPITSIPVGNNINVFGPAAGRSISSVQSATSDDNVILPKYSKNLEDQATEPNSPKWQEEKITRSKPTVAARRPSYIQSAKTALKKFRRSNAKDLDKTQTHKDVLNEKELQPTPTRELNRSNDQRSGINDEKESSFEFPTKHPNSKIAFKKLRDKFEFGKSAVIGDNSGLKKHKEVKKSTGRGGTTRFKNFVSSIFK